MSRLDEPTTPTLAGPQDRRTLLRRLAMGAAVTGTLGASQMLQSSPVRAAGSCLTKLLQINPATCGEQTTTNPASPQPSSCVPGAGTWMSGHLDAVGFTCGANQFGGTITISASCTPRSAKAVKFCALASGTKDTCVDGTISGQNVTFPGLDSTDPLVCTYVAFRIEVECCG